MRIAVDVREFKKGVYTGLRTIESDLLAHAGLGKEHELVFFGNQDTDIDSIPAEGKRVVLREYNTFWWDQIQLPLALKREKADVFFSPYIKTPLWRVCPYVNTIADLIPLSFPKHGGLNGVAEKIHFFVSAFIYGRRSIKVITLSEDAKSRISSVFGVGKEKIKVAYPAVNLRHAIAEDKQAEYVRKYRLDEPYILYVGNFKPHKNVRSLMKAYGLLPQAMKTKYKLLLVGGDREQWDSMSEDPSLEGNKNRIVPVTNLPHENIPIFIKNASLFVFPSLAEGFGIPPVEAMALGVPVAASGVSPMTEVLGEAAVYFNPKDPGNMAKVISDMLSDGFKRKEAVSMGTERAGRFTAENLARNVLEALCDAGLPKTLLVSSEFPPVVGGMSTQLFSQWKRLPRGSVAILTASFGKGDPSIDGGLDIIRERYPLGPSILNRTMRTISVLWHMCRQNSLRKIVKNHCGQIMSAGLGGLIIKKVKGTPFAAYVYSADILEFSKRRISKWFLTLIMRNSELIIANSSFTRDLVIKNRLSTREKVIVLTPAVDADAFSPTKGDNGVKSKYGINDKVKVILTVARLSPRKGHYAVISAMAEMVKKDDKIIYLIVGDGPERSKLKALVDRLGLNDHVVFIGEVPDTELVHFYNACDVFVMVPKRIDKVGDVEGFGIVFLEAGACEKPVVAGDSGGVSEAVVHGKTGLLVEPENVDEIRKAIERILSDKNYAKELGKNSRERVIREFSWDSRAEILKKYI